MLHCGESAQVVKRLNEIDAYGAEARAASILSGLSFDTSMQVLLVLSHLGVLVMLPTPFP